MRGEGEGERERKQGILLRRGRRRAFQRVQRGLGLAMANMSDASINIHVYHAQANESKQTTSA